MGGSGPDIGKSSMRIGTAHPLLQIPARGLKGLVGLCQEENYFNRGFAQTFQDARVAAEGECGSARLLSLRAKHGAKGQQQTPGFLPAV